MPGVRAQYGRAAVWRRLWGWPLRSPRRMGMVLLVLFGVGLGIGYLSDGAAPDAPDRGTVVADPDASVGRFQDGPAWESSNVQPVDPSPPDAGPKLSVPDLGPTRPQTPAAAAVVDVAQRFASGWVNHPEGMTSEEWVAQLRPFTARSYWTALESVSPANVPAEKVTRAPRVVTIGGGVAVVDVATDELILRLNMARLEDGWRVMSYERAG